MKKLLILSQCALQGKYWDINTIAKETWASRKYENVETIFYYGKYDIYNKITDRFEQLPDDGKSLLIGNDLIIGTHDYRYPKNHPFFKKNIHNDTRNEKFIESLKFCLLNKEFDYILRISCTSYVDVEEVLNYINILPSSKVYNGARNLHEYKIPFISGHCVIMSKDVVKVLVDNYETYMESNYMEDLATGHLLITKLNYINPEDQDDRQLFKLLHEREVSLNSFRTSPYLLTYKFRDNFENFYRLDSFLKN